MAGKKKKKKPPGAGIKKFPATIQSLSWSKKVDEWLENRNKKH